LNRRRLTSLLRHRAARDPLTRTVRDAARAHEAEAWLVGGYVRDAALGRRASDVDLIAGRGVARLVAALQARWSTRGFRFRKRGVTTWRFAVAGRQADLVDASRRGLERDLLRRDFTVNAVAFDLTASTIVDPLRGLAHLRSHRLRLPRSDAIRNDPLRALRAVRFLAQLPAFTLDREARTRAERAGPGLRRAAPERVRVELDKLLAAEHPARGLDTLEALGLLNAVLPELAPLRSCLAGADRPDVWRHTVDAIATSSRPGRLPGAFAVRHEADRRLLRWALLLHDISKPETHAVRADGRPTFHGHEALGADRAEAVLARLLLPRNERKRVRRLILHHLRPSHLADAGAPARGMRRLVRAAGSDLPLLAVHAACDALASGAPDADRRWRRLRRVLVDLVAAWGTRRAVSLPRLLTGKDVMRELEIAAGPRVGERLEEIRELQEEGELKTRAAALAWLRARSS